MDSGKRQTDTVTDRQICVLCVLCVLCVVVLFPVVEGQIDRWMDGWMDGWIDIKKSTDHSKRATPKKPRTLEASKRSAARHDCNDSQTDDYACPYTCSTPMLVRAANVEALHDECASCFRNVTQDTPRVHHTYLENIIQNSNQLYVTVAMLSNTIKTHHTKPYILPLDLVAAYHVVVSCTPRCTRSPYGQPHAACQCSARGGRKSCGPC
jgi:hypothetical protein